MTRHLAVAAALLIGLCAVVPPPAVAGQFAADWQSFGVTTGSASKAKFAGVRGHGVNVAGALRPLPMLSGIPLSDRWAWRPSLAVTSLIDGGRQDGVHMVALGGDVEHRFMVIDGWLQPFVMLGFAPTVLSDAVLGERVIGGEFHFTSAVVVGVKVVQPVRLRIAYRLQHTSNGGTQSQNPGVDLSGVMLEVPFRRR